MQNWQVPKWFPERPRTHKGKTRIVANERGHLLPEIPRNRNNIWGEYVNTWDLPKLITRKLGKTSFSNITRNNNYSMTIFYKLLPKK